MQNSLATKCKGVYYTLSNFSNFTPNTWYTKYTFFHGFFFKIGRKKSVIGVEQSVPIKLCVIGVSGKSKSCLGLGHTETWHHQMSFEKFLMLPIGTLSFLFFCQRMGTFYAKLTVLYFLSLMLYWILNHPFTRF